MSYFLEAVRPKRRLGAIEVPASCLVSVLMEWKIPASVGRGFFHSQGWALKLMGGGVRWRGTDTHVYRLCQTAIR